MYYRGNKGEHINPFLPSRLSYLNFSDKSICSKRGIWVVLLLPCFIEIPVLNANRVDPDQTPHSAALDLGLRYLQMSLLWEARHKWVKTC